MKKLLYWLVSIVALGALVAPATFASAAETQRCRGGVDCAPALSTPTPMKCRGCSQEAQVSGSYFDPYFDTFAMPHKGHHNVTETQPKTDTVVYVRPGKGSGGAVATMLTVAGSFKLAHDGAGEELAR